MAYSVSDFSSAHASDAVARTTFSAQANKPYAADAADATARANLALGISDVYWQVVRNDLEIAAKDMFYTRNSLWAKDDISSEISETWTFSKNALKKASAEKWQFWIAWYECILAGKNTYPDLMAPILNELTKEDWLGDPVAVNARFDDVLAVYESEDAASQPQSPVDFTFDDLIKVMRMIGIGDNLRHLKAPEVVQSFLDDAQEVRDGFIDFVDDAREIQGGNFVGVLRKRAETILSEFQRSEDMTHLRAERIVMLAQELELYSKDSNAVPDLGDTLYAVLQNRLMQLKRLCRQHFRPSYVSLAPFAQLRLEQIEQDEVIRILDEALKPMTALPNEDHYALDAEGAAVLADMLRELQDTRAAIANADDDAFVAILQDRFAESSGALGLSINKFYERSAEAMNKARRHADVAMKTNKRFQGLDSILDSLKEHLGAGGS